MKGIAKAAISVVWYCGDILARSVGRSVGRRVRPRFVVLYYHSVNAESRTSFARQMEALKRRFRVVSAGHRGRLDGVQDCVAVTFDDAFRSVREHALPEMVGRALPATIFVPVDFLGRAPAWEMEADGTGEEVMSADELRSLPDLVELGSHTLTHPHLSRLGQVDLRHELTESRARLAELIGSEVEVLAFPYGDYDERTVIACREAGYQRVFSIEPRPVDLAGRDFIRGRVAVDPADRALVFHLKACGAYAWMSHASALLATMRAWRHRRR